MPGPLDAAGALPEPSEYASLSMDRHLTGLWTQRSPLRDADVPYLYGKFYSASRFDSLIDGINREITSRLTNARRPGTSPYNTNTFPAINSFYPFRYIEAPYSNQTPVLAYVLYTAGNSDPGGHGRPTLYINLASMPFQVGETVTFEALVIDTDSWLNGQTATVDAIIADQIVSHGGTWLTSGVPPLWPYTPSPGLETGYASTSIIPVPGGAEVIRVIADGKDGVIYDATAGQKTALMTKAANADKARFLTVGNQLYIADRVDFKKLLVSPLIWVPSAHYTLGQYIIDPNGNIQVVTTAGMAATTPPSLWANSFNTTTTDGSIVWTCKGSALQAWQIPGPNVAPTVTGTAGIPGWEYGFTYSNSITKQETTGSPLSSPVGAGSNVIGGPNTQDPQWDTINIYRTALGQSTPILLTSLVAWSFGPTWTYTDPNTPDTSLVAQQAMPQFNSGDPPPTGFTAPEYHCNRVWGIVGNNVVYSNPFSTSGFAPLNFVPIQGELPVRLFAGVSSLGATLFVLCTVNMYAIYGDGTTNNPFTPAVKYMANVGIQSYDCVTQVGSTYYAFTTKRKFISLDPGAGYVEAGFPIGDQFNEVTTGGTTSRLGYLYNPASAYVTWNEADSGDSAMYVSDGSVGWFRFSPVASPESGYLWSPRAVILAGTSAVQSIEVATGITYLLIGPQSSGPILCRDPSVSTDWISGAPAPYPSWDVKGNIVLCTSGQVAEIAHIALKSAAVGSRPVVSLLLGEISPTLTTPFDPLTITSTDPPDLPPSTTVYSDRYSALQNGVCPKCDNFQLKVDYGVQAAADELLMFDVYGAKHSERKQQ